MNLSDIHDCEKCHGKIVAISRDEFGNTYCGYCGEKVDYTPWFKEIEKEMKNSKHFKTVDRYVQKRIE